MWIRIKHIGADSTNPTQASYIYPDPHLDPEKDVKFTLFEELRLSLWRAEGLFLSLAVPLLRSRYKHNLGNFLKGALKGTVGSRYRVE